MQPSGSISPTMPYLVGRIALLQVPLRFEGHHGWGESHAGTTGAGELLKKHPNHPVRLHALDPKQRKTLHLTSVSPEVQHISEEW